MNFTKEIKARVSASELLPFYGLQVDRAGFCKCPFHQGDNTGSLKVYTGDRGWHCFACGAGSSVVDFVMGYFGLSFNDAQKKINDDFRLGLPMDKELSAAERANAAARARQRREQMQARERKKEALRDAVDRALTEFVLMDKWLMCHQPNGQMVARHDAAWYNYKEAEAALEKFSRANH